MAEFPKVKQGVAVPASAEDLRRDRRGHTNPNLHRRVNPQEPDVAENALDQEVAPRDYQFAIEHVYSYRTTTLNTHDEDSEDPTKDPETGKVLSEIP